MDRFKNVVQELSNLLIAIKSCHSDWCEKHWATVEWIEKQFLPTGSGFDCGSKLDRHESRPQRLVFNTAFHHMNEHGYYDGWSNHQVVVTPIFDGFDMRITGRNRNDIKDCIHECFHLALSSFCTRFPEGGGPFEYGWFFTKDGKDTWMPWEDR